MEAGGKRRRRIIMSNGMRDEYSCSNSTRAANGKMAIEFPIRKCLSFSYSYESRYLSYLPYLLEHGCSLSCCTLP